MACFPSNLIAQFTIVYVSVFVLMSDKLFPQFMLLFYFNDCFVINFYVMPCLLLGWIGFSRDTVDLFRIDMIGEYQPLVINTFLVKNSVPVKVQFSSHGRVVTFFVVVLYSVVSSVLYVAVEIEGKNSVVTFFKWT